MLTWRVMRQNRTSPMLVALLLPLVHTGSSLDAAPRPNIVLILCDDMGYSDLGCYGGEVRTPNLDRLARQGLRFTQFYNCAKCNTTRASVITGLHPRFRRLLTREMVTIPEVMRTAGYRTALSGKWHLGSGPDQHPFRRGFDRYWGLLDGCCNFFDPAQRDPAFKGARIRKFGHDDKQVSEFPENFYMTDAITDHAIESIRLFANEKKPFFVHVCYTAPHYPLHAKPEDIAKYKGKYLEGWEKLRDERYRRMVEMGLVDPKWKRPGQEPRAKPWADTKHREWEDLRMAVYAAMIDSMDQNIGRLLRTLRDSGVDKNTLVLFLSDNGGCGEQLRGDRPENLPGPKEFYTTCGPGWAWAQNTPFRRFKAWVHEGGIATPLIVHWPGVVKPGTLTDQVGHIIDFLPTFAELAGATYPRKREGKSIIPVEGLSLAPVLRGERRAAHKRLFWQWSGNHAVREGDLKLVWEKPTKRWALYDIAVDRTETKDLRSELPERAEAMAAAYVEWAKKVGGPVPGRTSGKKKTKRARNAKKTDEAAVREG